MWRAGGEGSTASSDRCRSCKGLKCGVSTKGADDGLLGAEAKRDERKN